MNFLPMKKNSEFFKNLYTNLLSIYLCIESCIGAEAVVTKDVPEGMIVVGAPAHTIGVNKHRNYVGRRWNVVR